jgi:Fe-S-cluster containining protein
MDGTKQSERIELLVLPQVQPVVTSCDGCGFCCTEVSVPPFLDEIDFVPKELAAEFYAAQMIEAELVAQKQPCIWHDRVTRRCRHHEHRPNICREYEIGGELCLETRTKFRVGEAGCGSSR